MSDLLMRRFWEQKRKSYVMTITCSSNSRENNIFTRQMSAMIHSACPTVTPVPNITRGPQIKSWI